MRTSARLLALAVVPLLAVALFSTARTAPAQAAGSPCHGYVYSFKKVSGVVRMTYWIYCSRKVDRIQLKAFLREGDRWSAMNTVTCRNTNVCKNEETLRDRAGSQSYFGRAYEGTWPPASWAKDNGSRWDCNAPGESKMRCGGAGKNL